MFFMTISFFDFYFRYPWHPVFCLREAAIPRAIAFPYPKLAEPFQFPVLCSRWCICNEIHALGRLAAQSSLCGERLTVSEWIPEGISSVLAAPDNPIWQRFFAASATL